MRTLTALLLPFFAVLMVAGPACLQAQDTDAKAREEWMAGFVKLEEGGRAEEAGDVAQALAQYRDALETFEAVRRRYPGWNPSLLGYRITYCTQRIRRLESQVQANSATLSQTDLAKLAGELHERIRTLTDENQALKQRLGLTAEALERARVESARTVSTAEDINAVMAERTRFREENTALRQQVEQLSADVAELRRKSGIEEVAKQLQGDLERTRAREQQLTKAFETYRKAYENVKEKLREASAAQDEWLRLQRELTDRSDAATAEAAEARRLATEAQGRLAALEQRRAEEAALSAQRQTAIEQSQRDLGQARQDLAASQAALAQSQRDLAASQAALAQPRQDLAASEAALAQSRQELAGSQAALAQSRLEAAEFRRQRDQAAAEAAARQGLDEQVRRLQAEQAASAARQAELERLLAATQAERDRLMQDPRRQREAPGEAVAPTLAAPAEVAALEEKARVASAERDAARAAVAALEEKARAAAAGRDEARAAVAALEEKARLAAVQHQEALQARDERLRAAEAAGAAAAEQHRREVEALRADLARLEGRVGTMQTQLQGQADQEKALAAARGEVAVLRQDLVRERTALAALKDQAAAAEASAKTLTARTQALEAENSDYTRRLRDIERATEDSRRGRDDNAEQLQQSRELLAAAEGERNQLRQKTEEQLALLRQQEKSLRDLEAVQRDLQAQLETQRQEVARLTRSREEGAAAFAREAAVMKAKVDVVDGLTASLGEADRLSAELKQRVQALEQDRLVLEGRLRETQSQVQERDREVARFREAMSRDVSAREQAVLRQLQEASARLAAETEKRRALEAALAALPSGGTAAPAASAPAAVTPADPETARRQAEQAAIIRGYLRQAVAAEKDGKVEAARWNYERVLAQDSENRLAAQRLGLIAAEQGNDEEAERYLKRAFKLDPDDLQTILPLGFTLLRRQAPDLAVSMLSRAVALEPGNAVAQRCLGLACSSLGWYDAAEVQFRRAHELNRRDGETAFNLAVLLSSRQPPRLDEARTWYQQALDLGVARDPGLDRLFGIGN
ncbi:MAG: tetratricopeptide repeat protein [Lentisphaerae bacterium]|nr:tetratricopeptide repeat protein [Lentisphaerota bacterium]